jgi:hypothetical protein
MYRHQVRIRRQAGERILDGVLPRVATLDEANRLHDRFGFQ